MRLLVALTITTAAAWRFPGLARPREEDVIEHEVTPTGPRELTIETHDYEAHESTMVLPFEDTHACLLQSLKDYLDTHAEDQFESKIMLKIGGHRVDSNAADYFRMMPDGVCARRPTFLRRGDGVRGGTIRHRRRSSPRRSSISWSGRRGARRGTSSVCCGVLDRTPRRWRRG